MSGAYNARDANRFLQTVQSAFLCKTFLAQERGGQVLFQRLSEQGTQNRPGHFLFPLREVSLQTGKGDTALAVTTLFLR